MTSLINAATSHLWLAGIHGMPARLTTCAALPVICSVGVLWRQLAGICGMHAKVKNINNQLVQWCHRWCNCGACHGDGAMPPMSCHWSFHFFLWLFCIWSTTRTTCVALPVICSVGILWRLLAGICDMHTMVKNKNDQLVWRQHQSVSNATHATPTEIFISFFDCFAFAAGTKTRCAAPPVSCSSGVSWRQLA